MTVLACAARGPLHASFWGWPAFPTKFETNAGSGYFVAANPETETLGRAVCYRCFKAESVCVCSTVTRLNNRTHITVVQHPRERHHPIGTARFLELGVNHVRVLEDTAGRLRRNEVAVDLPADAGVLYPGAEARDLAELLPHERPSHLVVIDGTWHQAKTLYRDVPWIRQLPHYKLNPSSPSRYRIRREPRADYVSTLEATLQALQLLEPDLGDTDSLLHAFDEMIDAQIARAAQRDAPRVRTRRREIHTRRLPRALFEEFEQLVVLYAESCSPEWSAAARAPVDSDAVLVNDVGLSQERLMRGDLLYFAAYRLKGGERFECLVKPDNGALNERHLKHMDLSPAEREALGEPVSMDEFRGRFRAFARRDDAYAAWNQSALGWLPDAPLVKGRSVFLKAAYGALQRFGGALEVIAAQEGFAAEDVAFAGRAKQRLGNALGLVKFLRCEALGAGR